MGFAAGSVTFRRFFLAGKHPKTPTDKWLAAFADRAFGRQNYVASDGIETGWIVPNHLFDVDFSEPHRLAVGRFVYVAMRLDRTAPPGNIIKSYQRMEEAAALAASGREFLSKEERALARQAAADRAEKEARDDAFRRLAAFPVLIDLEQGMLYFSTAGKLASDKLAGLFSETFDMPLTPADAEEVAFRTCSTHGTQRDFEDAEPFCLVDPPGEADGAASPLGGGDHTHLGRELLLWMWYRTAAREGVFEFLDGTSATVAIDRAMQLDCPLDVTGRDTIRNDAPASSPEARAALGVGKMPAKMGLLIGASAGEWALNLSAADLAITGLAIPKAEDKEPGAVLEHRFTQIVEASSTVDRLFAAFLRLRFGNGWAKELADMKRWAGAAKPAAAMQLATA